MEEIILIAIVLIAEMTFFKIRMVNKKIPRSIKYKI
jgi:hypothetical protein